MTVNLLTSVEKLSWAQFREVEKSPDGTSAAQTASLLQPGTIRTGKNGKDIMITQLQINVSVNASESWVVKGKQTAALLKHERLHYRIAIVVAYELDAALLSIKAANARALQAAANALLAEKKARVDALSNRYDRETKGGTDSAAQQRWQTQVASWEQHKKAS
jgi:hypothetical protein